MIDVPAEVSSVEARLKDCGVPLRRFFRDSKIAHTTWERWRSGKTSPTIVTWQRCMKAAETIVSAAAATADGAIVQHRALQSPSPIPSPTHGDRPHV